MVAGDSEATTGVRPYISSKRNVFMACAKNTSMKRGQAKEIVDEVLTAVSQWKQFADQSGVPPGVADGIAKNSPHGYLEIEHALRHMGISRGAIL